MSQSETRDLLLLDAANHTQRQLPPYCRTPGLDINPAALPSPSATANLLGMPWNSGHADSCMFLAFVHPHGKRIIQIPIQYACAVLTDCRIGIIYPHLMNPQLYLSPSAHLSASSSLMSLQNGNSSATIAFAFFCEQKATAPGNNAGGHTRAFQILLVKFMEQKHCHLPLSTSLTSAHGSIVGYYLQRN